MPYLSHIFIMHALYGDRMYTQSITLSYSKKALTLINFKERTAHTAPLFFKSKIVKLPDKIKIEHLLFISKYVNNKLPPIFNSWFLFYPLLITMGCRCIPYI